jgi:cytochrome c oxidase subunit 4
MDGTMHDNTHAHGDGRTAEHAPQPYGLFIKVWAALMLLTCITVGASVNWPGAVGTAVAMAVTPVKASLVLLFFMHLKWEPPVFKIMFLTAVGLMAVFFGLSFFDYLYR